MDHKGLKRTSIHVVPISLSLWSSISLEYTIINAIKRNLLRFSKTELTQKFLGGMGPVCPAHILSWLSRKGGWKTGSVGAIYKPDLPLIIAVRPPTDLVEKLDRSKQRLMLPFPGGVSGPL